jgi:hypothetical protein
LKKLVQAYQEGGRGARDVLALQNLLPLLSSVAGADQKLVVRKVSLLSASAPGAHAARNIVGAAEQVRAATGVDLTAMAKRFGG